MPAQMYLPHFLLKQKFAMTANRYELWATGDGGAETRLMGMAQQKRMAFKEQVTFYEDESKQRAVFAFQARKRIDLGAGYDITDESGQPLGYFKKEFGASLLRSTFHLEGPGYAGTGAERSQLVAIVRRLVDIPFLPIHFDFTTADGTPLMSVERAFTARDRYMVSVPHPEVDFRVAASVAVGLDALMQR
jgi:uncharacterized protein YxjI